MKRDTEHTFHAEDTMFEQQLTTMTYSHHTNDKQIQTRKQHRLQDGTCEPAVESAHWYSSCDHISLITSTTTLHSQVYCHY